MKDHLAKYFPERFESRSSTNFQKVFNFIEHGRSRLRCESTVINIFKNSSELNLLVKAMKKHGCDFKLSRHIVCEDCYTAKGGYDPDTNQIVVCQNGGMFRDRVMTTIMHEMIHMFDVCRAKFDFNNLEHVACTEVSKFTRLNRENT